MAPRTPFVTAAVILLLLPLLAACTGTRIREFTRESYEPSQVLEPPSRVFAAEPQRVFDTLVVFLEDRDARIADSDREAGRLIAVLPWSGPVEAAESVALGRVRRVVTRARRSYRSYSPLDFRCNDCVVRNGKITGEETRLLEDVTIRLEPGGYRLEAFLGATVEAVRSGTRVELALEVVAAPPEPPGLAPQSTGQLESSIFDILENGLR
jgi:hypothetical protein